MRPLSLLLVACALLVGGVSAQTQSITTPPNFANNNQGSPGGGVYFDITINPAVLVIEHLELNTPAPAGTSVAVDIYTCPTTYVGNEANMAVWTLVGSCTGTSAGAGVPTLIDVPNFAMTAGTYGMAIANSGGHAYTNGTGANQTVSTPEITLNLGSATNVAFAGTPFTPRVANLTLYYDVSGTVGGPCIRDRQQNSAEATLTVDGGSSANLSISLGPGSLSCIWVIRS